jgi:FlaA1/EpsC-like NDP-sugar epimerase
MINGSVREHSPTLADLDTSADHLLGTDVDAPSSAGNLLKPTLKALDAAGLSVGWGFAVAATAGRSSAGPLDPLQLTLLAWVGVTVSLMAMASKRLWLSRVCAVRSAELAGVGQTAVISALAVLVAGDLLSYTGPARFGVIGAFSSFVLVMGNRAAYSAWLRRARRRGRYIRRLVMVGTSSQALDLARLINGPPGGRLHDYRALRSRR